MMILGLQGSPRRKSNTAFLLTTFLEAAEKKGAEVVSVDVCRQNIMPCKELVVCEKKGYCPIDDDMKHDIYPLLRRADVVVAATPIFFYNATAQLKALIDRSQTLWARKYRLKLKDPGSSLRQGFLLAVGATGGKNLFEGLFLTAQYFFDAIAASYAGSLTYKHMEHPGDLKNHPTVRQDVEEAVNRLMKPYTGRQTLLFASQKNDCRSQMAWASAKYLAGDRFDVVSGGTQPASRIREAAVQSMMANGIDLAFGKPRTIAAALSEGQPDVVITMDNDVELPAAINGRRQHWDIPPVEDADIGRINEIRDQIERQVRALVLG